MISFAALLLLFILRQSEQEALLEATVLEKEREAAQLEAKISTENARVAALESEVSQQNEVAAQSLQAKEESTNHINAAAKKHSSGDLEGALQNLNLAKEINTKWKLDQSAFCLLYTSPSPRDATLSRMPSSA